MFHNDTTVTLHPPSTYLPLEVAGTPTIGTLGDVPTTPTTIKRSYHHLAILKHHHHNNECNVDNNSYNNNVKNTVSATHIHERSISSPHSNRNGIQYDQLSKILFFSDPSQPNHSSFLRMTTCGILLNYRITAF